MRTEGTSAPAFHIMSTFFYTKLTEPGGFKNVLRWADKPAYNWLDCKNILVPIHDRDGDHWTLARICLSGTGRGFYYCDSLHWGQGPEVLVRHTLAHCPFSSFPSSLKI